MRQRLLLNMYKLTIPGFLLLQAAGCTFAAVNELAQTILLGVTAAGAVAILRNI